ncbi:NAD(P)-binding domain-containing protein [Cecembia sp.]|uniref:NAD(P)-binding domain-containing protein n=1 Tax=Cecembia sp. TaxID=1898110 RepID=UPI0025C7271A|nr:NAD(P)-binding domain-containing protein [Cecembia sp.]
MSRVSIIGLGWLGEPLSHALIQQGYTVKGSATSPEKVDKLNQKGVEAYELRLGPQPEGLHYEKLLDTDILFINIPPRTRVMPESFHPEQIKHIKEMAIQAKIPWVIFVSSTSVYPDNAQIAKESDVIHDEGGGNNAIIKAESILLAGFPPYDLTIIRFGGLLGLDRIPGKYFSGKENVIGDSPVNYIHQEDAVRLVAWVIEQKIKNEILNGVAPLHPKRRDIYEKNANDLGFSPPLSYTTAGNSWKEISADKILDTGFEFKFPNPLNFSYRLR